MASWFARNPALDPSDPAAQLGAYREGRRDERLQNEANAPDRRLAKAELDDARDLGRREARLRRRATPLGTILRLGVLILAAMAVVTISLAVSYGSFAAAGHAADTALSAIFQAVVPAH